MKRYIKYSFSLAVALVILGTSKNSYAVFPTFDVTSFKERLEGTIQTIKSYGKVKEATETASDINNSVGSATKSISELGVDQLEKAKEKKDKLEKAKKTYEKTKAQVEKRKKQLEDKKKEIENAKAKIEAFKQDVEKIKSDYDATVADVNQFKSDIEAAKNKVDEYKDKAESILGNSSDAEEATTTTTTTTTTTDSTGSTSTVESTSVIGRQAFTTADDSETSTSEIQEVDDSKYVLSTEEIKETTDETQAEAAEDEEEKAAEEAKEDASSEEVGKAAFEEEEARLKLLKAKIAEGSSLSIGEKALEDEKKRIEELQKLKEESKSSTPSLNNGSRRKPFGKTSSYYKNSEQLAFADTTSVESDSTDGPTGVTDEGVFIFSEEGAIYCDLNVNTDLVEGSEKMKECLVKILSNMSSDNPSVAADGQKEYMKILKEQALGTLAENMRLNNEAAQFDSAVLDPLAEDIGGATNTRDDVSTLSLTNKEAVYVLNRLTFSSSLQLTLDAFKQIGYFDVKDMEETEESTSTSDTSSSSAE